MESPPSSRFIFYDPSGVVIPTPVEGCICGIAIDVRKELRPSISLKLSGYVLPVQTTETSAYSEWPPCGPGHYELSLECDQIRERRTITVMPRYFTESEFTSVIRDLTEALPHTIASLLNECGAKLGVFPARDHKSLIEEEYLKLHRAIKGTKEKLGMLQVLAILQRDCHTILSTELELRSVSKLRRPDISKLPQAISIPGNVISEDRVYQMFDVVAQRSFEAYENRLVKAYVLALRSRLSRLQANLKSAFAPSVMATELDALANEFHLAYMRANFLREVKNPSMTAIRVTMVLLKNPAYRAVLEGYLALNDQSHLTLEEPALNIPLNHFPYLYQRWAVLKVLCAMLQVGAESGYRCVNHHWVRSNLKSTTIQVINDGRPAVQLSCPTSGRLVSFIPWHPSGETATIPGQESSMGVAIAIETPEKPIEVLLFDPKYWVDSKSVKMNVSEKTDAKTDAQVIEVSQMLRVVEPLQEDVDEILRVRDKIRAADGAGEIQYGAILYPGQKKQLAQDIEALPAHPNDGDTLQNTICDVLRRFLA